MLSTELRPATVLHSALRALHSRRRPDPRWSPDGQEIFYRNAKAEMVAVAVESTSPLTLGARRVLFTLVDVVEWDVAPDGRFLVLRDAGDGVTAATTQMVVVEGLFRELRDRASR